MSSSAVDNQPSPSTGRWILFLGATGFISGFLGPILITPNANQGPLLGIFVTGPGGAIAGLILGVIFRILGISGSRSRQALLACCIALALGTLVMCVRWAMSH